MEKHYIIFLILILISSCIGGGTHGYIKGYRYNVSKYDLEKTIHQIMASYPDVYRDSIKDYYNNDSGYIRLKIIYKVQPYSYTFRFYGRKEYWDTSKTSEIFIAYAYDERGRGGSAGNGGVPWYNYKLKKKLTAPFELNFIGIIDSIIGIRHTER